MRHVHSGLQMSSSMSLAVHPLSHSTFTALHMSLMSCVCMSGTCNRGVQSRKRSHRLPLAACIMLSDGRLWPLSHSSLAACRSYGADVVTSPGESVAEGCDKGSTWLDSWRRFLLLGTVELCLAYAMVRARASFPMCPSSLRSSTSAVMEACAKTGSTASNPRPPLCLCR